MTRRRRCGSSGHNAATYGIDPTRIAIGGSSAGAITALNVGYNPDDAGAERQPGLLLRRRARRSLSGAAMRDDARAPAAHRRSLFHGTADPTRAVRVGPEHRDGRGQRRPARLPRVVAGRGARSYAENRQQILDTTTNFLYSELDLAWAGRVSRVRGAHRAGGTVP